MHLSYHIINWTVIRLCLYSGGADLEIGLDWEDVQPPEMSCYFPSQLIYYLLAEATMHLKLISKVKVC